MNTFITEQYRRLKLQKKDNIAFKNILMIVKFIYFPLTINEIHSE